MKFKKIVLLAFALSSLISISLYADEDLPKDKPGTAVFVMSSENNSSIKVTTEFIEEETRYLNVDMKIPVMDNFNNKRFQRKLNKKIKNNQLNIKCQIEKESKKICPSYPYELLTNYNVKSNGDIFSLGISVYDYRGGAHGMTRNTYYNVDTRNSRLISLEEYISDYYGKDTEYKEIINQEINKQIKDREEEGQVFFDDDDGFTGIKEGQAFYINEDGQLVIVFGLYEIAPYAEGIIEFIIPNELLSFDYKSL
ncbi:MAG: DUF3298 and DUF4163 domain-containing protein [Epulopiscium sp.]|nr:DUF3298 and DUF4163 domain-containing protein [Candidatus Epulonipiscium sp.]